MALRKRKKIGNVGKVVRKPKGKATSFLQKTGLGGTPAKRSRSSRSVRKGKRMGLQGKG